MKEGEFIYCITIPLIPFLEIKEYKIIGEVFAGVLSVYGKSGKNCFEIDDVLKKIDYTGAFPNVNFYCTDEKGIINLLFSSEEKLKSYLKTVIIPWYITREEIRADNSQKAFAQSLKKLNELENMRNAIPD